MLATSALILQSLQLFQVPSYKLFLRGYQAIMLAANYILWKYITSYSKLLRLYVYISIGTFFATSILYYLIVLYRNLSFRRGHSQALISKYCGNIRMTIDVLRSLDIRAGQYVNIQISSISFWSFLQSHPFPIASWEAKDGVTSLNILIDLRKGLTQKLYTYAEYYRERPSKETDRILDERPRTTIKLLKYQDILCESVKQGFKSTAVDCYKFHEILPELIEEGIKNIQLTISVTNVMKASLRGLIPFDNYQWTLWYGNSYWRLQKGLDNYYRVRYRRVTIISKIASIGLKQLRSPDAGNTLDLVIIEFWQDY